jgi:hypothetical protein
MIIYKNHIDNYIKCNYLFALDVIAGKKVNAEDMNGSVNKFLRYKTSILTADNKELSKNVIWFKEHICSIVSQEMKDGIKQPTGFYRVKFSERFQNNLLKIEPDGKLLINKINAFLSPLTHNMCIGFNVPVEIPIRGTNIMYKDVIDFVLLDQDSGDIVIVEIDDIKKNMIDSRIKSWYHYKVPYSFLGDSMEKNVRVFILDPNTMETLEYYFHKSSFDQQYKHLVELVTPIKTSNLVKNLFSCSTCKNEELCSDEIAIQEIIKNGEDDD